MRRAGRAALSANESSERINDYHEKATSSARTAIAHALEAGRLLLEAKSRIAHGGWLLWIKENCRFSVRTAQGYMRLAARALEPANAQPVAHLGVREALEILAEPGLEAAGPPSTATSTDRPEKRGDIADIDGEGTHERSGPAVWAEALPPSGYVRFGVAGQVLLEIFESPADPGFYHLTTIDMFDKPSDPAIAHSTKKPVAAVAVRLCAELMGFIGEVQWLCDAPWTERRELPCFSTTARSVEKR